jgi:hypothetical protein
VSVSCFTSITFSYLARARVLAETLKRYHTDWRFSVCITDREPGGFAFDVRREPFDEVIWGDELPIESIRSWLFKHDLVETCTGVKAAVLERLLRTGADRVFFFDPDIAILASLQPLADLLEESSILLTPHQIEPEADYGAIVDNEIGSLRHGAFNLGFLAIRNDDVGRRMARWWRDRLELFCYDDPTRGLFVDQKWCDLLPSLFDNVRIVRDPGYNVASWNVGRRKLAIDLDGTVLAGGQPLRFFHFTKFGSIGDVMTQRYAGDNVEVYELQAWYQRMLERQRADVPSDWWHYGRFEDGTPIPAVARKIYRGRGDLEDAFPDPFATGDESLLTWLREEGHVAPEGR